VRRSLQNKQSLHTISQNKPQLCKNMKSNLWCFVNAPNKIF
jgi:hypothetical protein